jgi:hypothetical protein
MFPEKDIRDFIQQVDPIELMENGFATIESADADGRELFVEATKEGAVLLAIELLRASLGEGRSDANGANHFPINSCFNYMEKESALYLEHIAIVDHKPAKEVIQQTPSTIKDMLLTSGCFVVTVFVLVALVVGLWTTITWIF